MSVRHFYPVAIAAASASSPRNPETTAAPSSSQMSGLASCRASSRQRDVLRARWISLAPTLTVGFGPRWMLAEAGNRRQN